jgi:plasmid stability protein
VSQRQANIRLDEELFERLEVAAFVHRRSFADEMRAALTDWTDKLQSDPLIAAASKSREPTPEPEAAQVSSLDAKRGRTNRRNA